MANKAKAQIQLNEARDVLREINQAVRNIKKNSFKKSRKKV
jgi:hypothetical protein